MNTVAPFQQPQSPNDKTNLSKLSDALSIKYVLGYNSSVRNNILALDEGRLAYPAGHNIVIFDVDHQLSQTYIYGTEGSLGITAMSLSPQKKFLAFAEETEKFGLIHVCDVSKREDKRNKKSIDKKRTFLSMDCTSKKYVALSFDPSEETRYLFAMSGEPDWMIIYWNWTSPKPLATFQWTGMSKIFHAVCPPNTDGTLLVLGNSVIKSFKYSSGNDLLKMNNITQSKSLKDQTQLSQNYVNYCWLTDGNLILGTDKGELIYLIAHNMEMKYILPTSPMDDMIIECMIPFSKGFIIGGNNATIYVYEKHEVEKKNQYVRIDKKIQVPNNYSRVISLVLIQKEELLVFGLSDGSLLCFPFNDRTSDEPVKFEPIFQPFHTAEITGLDICVRKSLVATCSLDRTVKIWNFKEIAIENDKTFEEPAYSVAFHPSGFFIVVGFADKIRMINILMNDLVTYKEIPVKGCKEIVFTHGGDRFAVCNGSSINIYNTYTGDNPSNQQYREHTATVQQVLWHENDFGFFSAGLDGNIYNWRLEDNINKVHIFSQSQLVINSICSTKDEKVYAACSNKNLYEIEVPKPEPKEKDLFGDYKKPKFPKANKIPTGVNLSQVVISHSNKFMFMATGEPDMPGSIRISSYPLGTSVHETFVHSKAIKKMRISYNDDYLFTIGEDGLLVIYEVNDKEAQNKREKEGSEAEYAEDFLISKDEFVTLKTKIEKYEKKLKEQEITNKIKAAIELKEKDAELNRLDTEIRKQQAHETEIYNALVKQKEDIMRKYQEEQQGIEKNHRALIKKKENEHKEAMRKEEERLNDIQEETQREKEQFEEYVRFFEANKQKIIEEKRIAYEQKLQEEKRIRKEIDLELEVMNKDFEEKREELETGAEREIDELRERNENEIKRISEEMRKNEMAKTTTEKKLKQQSTTIEEIKTKLREILEQISQIKDHNDTLRKEKDQQEREIKEREDTIQEKKKRIGELTKKTQELEKFKFVLDYKIKELRRDIGPREQEIAKMKEQINNMNAEILHFRRTNKNLSLIVYDLSLRQKGMQKEIKDQSDVITENENYIKAFVNDLLESHQVIHDYKKLKKAVLRLNEKYLQNEKKKPEGNVDLQREFIAQRAYLETSVKTIKDKFAKNMKMHEKDNIRIINENVDLIREINDLNRRKKQVLEEKRETAMNKEAEARKNLENLEKEAQKNEDEINKVRNLISDHNKGGDPQRRHSGMKLPSLT